MAEHTQIPLAAEWKGVNRLLEAAALEPAFSPDCMDCAHDAVSLRQIGLLGPRKGRSRAQAYSSILRGVVPLDFPYGHYRVTSLDNGTWNADVVPWPSLPVWTDILAEAPIGTCGWMQLTIAGATPYFMAEPSLVGENNMGVGWLPGGVGYQASYGVGNVSGSLLRINGNIITGYITAQEPSMWLTSGNLTGVIVAVANDVIYNAAPLAKGSVSAVSEFAFGHLPIIRMW